MSRFKFFLSLVTACVLLVSNTSAASKLDGVHPLTILPCDGPIIIGSLTTIRVTLSGPAVGNEVVTLTATSGLYVGLPASVTPQPGATYVDITGIFILNFGWLASLQATIGQSTVGASIPIGG